MLKTNLTGCFFVKNIDVGIYILMVEMLFFSIMWTMLSLSTDDKFLEVRNTFEVGLGN